MSGYSLGISVAPAQDVAKLAARAEAAGFETAWTSAMFGHPIYSLRWIREGVLPSVARGLAESGRKREDFPLCLAVCCAVGKDVRAAKRAAAAPIALYGTVN